MAGPPVSVEVRGVAELSAAMPRFADAVQQGADGEARKAAERVADATRASVPRRTGFLGSSIRASDRGAHMGDGVPYAHFVEYGGRGHAHVASGAYLGAAGEAETEPFRQGCETVAATQARSFPWPNP